jgi:glutamate/tyrosine decarboxylase-like PLP-dependent enzyme
LAAPPTLTIVNFRVKSNRLDAQQTAVLHSQIAEEVTRDGQRWISDTIVNGASVLRMMIISYLTEERHLQDLQIALETAARTVTSRAH